MDELYILSQSIGSSGGKRIAAGEARHLSMFLLIISPWDFLACNIAINRSMSFGLLTSCIAVSITLFYPALFYPELYYCWQHC
nr:hypothetical protein [Escherichia coli]